MISATNFKLSLEPELDKTIGGAIGYQVMIWEHDIINGAIPLSVGAFKSWLSELICWAHSLIVCDFHMLGATSISWMMQLLITNAVDFSKEVYKTWLIF